ncbi:MAG: prolyl oligopeptidase family serine peptidase, partial [Gemmatimonadetes bacterium]|nr:prolyl oligopeptidase family serine peptidase [Gemmatimonadota bacterium]
MNRIPVAYGYWKSAITAKTMGARTPLYDVQWIGDGSGLVWMEQRSDTGVLVCRKGSEAPHDLTDGHPVRGGVGYGGGDFTVADDFVVFAEKDGRLYRQSLAPGSADSITPAFGAAASPAVSRDGKWVIYVHTCESVDVVALVDSKGSGWPVNLVRGADFYMQPVWHPDCERIAWIEWDQPQMPWDGTRLKTARLDTDRRNLADERLIAGDTDTPVFQPAYSPDGRYLSYIITEGEWDSLVVLDLETGERRAPVAGTTLADPAWVQGVRVYGWGTDSDTLYFRSHERGFASLWKVSLASGRRTQLETPVYTWMMQLSVSPARNALACIASSSAVPERVVTLDENDHTAHRRSQSEMIPAADLSIPEPITWTSPGGSEVHGLYYPPASSRFTGSGKPPVVVSIHGGPTGQSRADYAAEIPFFTNRGYACLYVNYRGSTGYGRSYMTALREHWGDYDTEDAVSGAHALVDRELADPERMVIKGGSAGGFTVLNVLAHHPGVFRAGLCLYGVTNLFGLATDTHKFE